MTKLNENGKEVKQFYDQVGQVVDKKHFNDSYKWQNLMGDSLLAGAGVGLSWYAVKKLVERAYRKKLHKALASDQTVEDTYEGRVTPVGNEFVMEEPSIKTAKDNKISLSENALNHSVKGPLKQMRDDPAVNTMIVDPAGNPRTGLAIEMAKHPAVTHSLAFASIPALFALSSWIANSGSKELFKKTVSDDVLPMSSEKEKARKEYEAAASMLRSVARGELEKESSDKRTKEAVFPAFVAPLLWGAGAGAAATAAGSYLWGKNKDNPKPIEEPSPEMNSNPTVNSAINLGLGLGALALLYPGYKFVQSMRKGYKDRTETVSDVQRALQAWDAQRQSRDEDFATLRAALAEEPDLLAKYFNPDGTLKKNLQIT